ncbi:MAG: SMP-30/gluconolactonase/LRE family protein [Chitinispirillaceae bacterium]|nr:SMP-30/gluconolactonase/LRE family protein [Chitinispirillaceae bacterium]
MVKVQSLKTSAFITIFCVFMVHLTACAHTVDLPSTLVSSGETVITVKTGISFGEGPAVDHDGNLYFSDRNPSRIWKVPVNGTASVFRNPANDANGMVFDSDGGLVVCEKKGLSRTAKDGTITRLLTSDTLGTEGPNDLTLTASGGIFFTSSVWGGNGKIFYLSPEGALKTVLSFTKTPNYPNGIELIEEKNCLYVNITQKDSIYKCGIDENMNITTIEPFCKTPSPDGLALDTEGNLWVAHTNGNHQITVFDSTGKKLGEIVLDGQESIQNCAFGGEGQKTLYIAGKTAIYRLKTAVAGRNTNGLLSVVRSKRITLLSKDKSNTQYWRKIVNSASGASVVNFETFNLQGGRQKTTGLLHGKGKCTSNSMTLIRMKCSGTIFSFKNVSVK